MSLFVHLSNWLPTNWLWRIRCWSRLPSLIQRPVTVWRLVRRIKDRLGEEVRCHCSTDLDSRIQLVALQCYCRAGYLVPLNATACCNLRRDVWTEKTSEACLNTYCDCDGVKPPSPLPAGDLGATTSPRFRDIYGRSDQRFAGSRACTAVSQCRPRSWHRNPQTRRIMTAGTGRLPSSLNVGCECAGPSVIAKVNHHLPGCGRQVFTSHDLLPDLPPSAVSCTP